jgi:hypothetical protein
LSVTYLPLTLTHDHDEIFVGRMRALEMYRAAKTDSERYRALFFVNHWRTLYRHALALQAIEASA